MIYKGVIGPLGAPFAYLDFRQWFNIARLIPHWPTLAEILDL